MTISNWVYCTFLLAIAAFYAGDLVGENRIGGLPDDVSEKVIASVRGVRPPLRDDEVLTIMNTKNKENLDPFGDPIYLGSQIDCFDQANITDENKLTWKDKMISYFLEKRCESSSSPDHRPASWLPQMFVLIGVQKGGTKAIHTFLEEHPHFVSRCNEQTATKELFFFNRLDDMDLKHVIPQGELQSRYSSMIQTACPIAIAALMNDTSKMYLDDTPLYIQDSHLIPQLLNCVMPKTKLMAILRNPTGRAQSHFNFYLERDWCTEKTFDEWIDINIMELSEAGVLNAKDPYDELLAWERYNDNEQYRDTRKCRTFVTRGLYAIQILHFMTALEAAGRSKSDLHVIVSESLQGDSRQDEYDKILAFLGLEAHTLQRQGSVHQTVYESFMNNATRAKLDKFYRPYNRRLYKLLNWEPVWD